MSCQVVTLRMKVGVPAHCECGHDLRYTILPDEFRYDSMQVDFYKYIDVCALTKYLLHTQTFATGSLQITFTPFHIQNNLFESNNYIHHFSTGLVNIPKISCLL